MSAPSTPPSATILRPGKDGLQRVPGNGRWTAETERIFLQALQGSCNIRASALAAGFSFQSAHKRRRRNADFARRWDEALEEGLLRLESELLTAARHTVEGTRYSGPITEVSFESALQLLAFHTRRRFGKAWRPHPSERQRTHAELTAELIERVARVRRVADWRNALPDDPAAAI